MDDGSPDDTYDFVSNIVKKYDSYEIYLYRQENVGVAETRNRCVELATGEYIAFMDQDDTVRSDYLERLVNTADKNNSDIAICGYVRRRDDGKILKTVFVDDNSFSKYRIVTPWARIYRKQFLVENNLKFLSTECGEDIYLNIQAYAITDKIAIIPQYTGYVWRYNSYSVSNTKQKSVTIAEAACDTFEKIVASLPDNRTSNRDDEEYFFIRACLFYLLFSSHSEKSSQVEHAYNRYFSFLEENFPNYMKNPLIRLSLPRGENFYVRFTVWGFMKLKRIGLAKAFAKCWSKFH